MINPKLPRCAHPSCNRSKSESLAAHLHRERWLDWIIKFEDDRLELGASGLSSAKYELINPQDVAVLSRMHRWPLLHV